MSRKRQSREASLSSQTGPQAKRREVDSTTASRERIAAEITSRNHRTSQLLRLPMELQLMIYEFVLGNGLIHIENNRFPFHRCCNCWDVPRLTHYVCQATVSEEDPPEEFKSYFQRKRPLTWMERICTKRHEECYIGGERVTIQLLRVCKSIYPVARGVLWSTNTFSFPNMVIFKQFRARLRHYQRHQLRSIHFENRPAFVFKDMDSTRNWIPLFYEPFVKPICSVREIYWSLDMGFRFFLSRERECPNYVTLFENDLVEEAPHQYFRFLEGIPEFKCRSLRRVILAIVEEPPDERRVAFGEDLMEHWGLVPPHLAALRERHWWSPENERGFLKALYDTFNAHYFIWMNGRPVA